MSTLAFTCPSTPPRFDNISALDTMLLPRHRWYLVKEAFSPKLVSFAIKDSECAKGDLVIDAFCGGGTVPVTAAAEGLSTLGFEVNPFLAFVSRTKLQQSSPESVEKYEQVVAAGVDRGAPSDLKDFSTFSERGGADKWLFNNEVLTAFEGGWQAGAGIRAPEGDILRLALIGAAMDVCNAVKDGKCLRYRPVWKEAGFGKADLLQALRIRLESIKADLEGYPLAEGNARICEIDSRNLTKEQLQGKRFKLCIMSPPYLNSFDYTDIYRPELFLGKFVRSQCELRALRQKTLRSHVQASWEEPKQLNLGLLSANSFSQIRKNAGGAWNKRIPSMIQAYFEDLRQVLANLRTLAQRDASVWIVVSTSSYTGVEIPVDLLIADIGSQTGWLMREIRVMRYLSRVPVQQWTALNEKKNGRPHLRESVIILDAMPHAPAK